MKLEHLVFVLLLLYGALLVAAFLTPPPDGSHGAAHPDFATMLTGGDPQRHAPTLWLGWGVGLTQILLTSAMIALGMRRPGDGFAGDLRGLGKPLMGGTLLYAVVWTFLILTYQGSMDGGSGTLYLALPAPTAVMIYLLWPVPLVFAAFFVFGFRRWVLSEEDQEAFARIVARRQAAQANKHENLGAN